MTGGGPRQNDAARTPQAELARIRETRERQDDSVRTALMEAMLERCGAQGYRDVAVQDVIDASDSNRVQFYRHFTCKQAAFVAAHEEAIEALSERLLGAAAASEGWRAGLEAALEELARELEARPARSKALLVEVHVAGSEAIEKRSEVLDRMAAALDGARREVDSRHPSPPSLTAPFMVGAIDSLVGRALLDGRPEDFAEAAPALVEMASAAYFGGPVSGPERKRPEGAGKTPPGQVFA